LLLFPDSSCLFLPRRSRQHRKYPQFQQSELFGLQDAFRKLDIDDKGYIEENIAIKQVQATEHQPYDVVRQALKEVDLDSSRRVELEDYVDVGNRPMQVWQC
jgi:plastin-1